MEFIQKHIAEDLIADRFFSGNEACALRAVPASLRAKALLNCWTRKEAYIKARGDGFRISLDGFEVFPDPGGSVVITDNDGSKWSLQSFVPAAGYAAALAAEGQGWHTRFMHREIQPRGR